MLIELQLSQKVYPLTASVAYAATNTSRFATTNSFISKIIYSNTSVTVTTSSLPTTMTLTIVFISFTNYTVIDGIIFNSSNH